MLQGEKSVTDIHERRDRVIDTFWEYCTHSYFVDNVYSVGDSAFWVKKNFGSKKYFGLKKIWVPRNFLVQKIVGPYCRSNIY